MKKENYLSWDTYFMSVAILSSYRSKDRKTQTGACIVDLNKKIVGVGYNGLPNGLNDNDKRFWSDEDDSDVINSKHTYVVHAEQNAIFNKIAQDIFDATLYVTLFPCKECAKSIIQIGIKKVIYIDIKEHYKDLNNAVKLMFNECGIKYEKYEDLNLKDSEFIKNLKNIQPE